MSFSSAFVDHLNLPMMRQTKTTLAVPEPSRAERISVLAPHLGSRKSGDKPEYRGEESELPLHTARFCRVGNLRSKPFSSSSGTDAFHQENTRQHQSKASQRQLYLLAAAPRLSWFTLKQTGSRATGHALKSASVG